MTVRVNKSAFNIREKLSELERPIGVKGNELMRAETLQDARDLVSAGRKNFIINGDFQVSQRGSYTSATAVSHDTYYLDRWKVDISGVTGTIQQLTNQTISSDSHIKNTVKMAATSTATAYIQLRQYVELNPALYGKTVTVSAWVKSNRSTRLRLESAYYGGSNWDSLTAHSGNGQWEKLSMTIRLQTSPSNIIFGVVMWGGSGGTTGGTTSISSGDYFEFTDFQVEVGKNATEFEHRSYSEELALCQRYYWEIGSYATNNWAVIATFIGNSSTRAFGSIPTPVTMRAHPVITFSQLNLRDSTSFTVTNLFRYSQTGRNAEYDGLAFEANTASGLTNGAAYRLNIENISGTSGYIRLNAEL